jgi:hypothetical protein
MDFFQIIHLIISGAFAGAMAGTLSVGGEITYVPAISNNIEP